jgi:hypothetical protein
MQIQGTTRRWHPKDPRRRVSVGRPSSKGRLGIEEANKATRACRVNGVNGVEREEEYDKMGKRSYGRIAKRNGRDGERKRECRVPDAVLVGGVVKVLLTRSSTGAVSGKRGHLPDQRAPYWDKRVFDDSVIGPSCT